MIGLGLRGEKENKVGGCGFIFQEYRVAATEEEYI